ncbi:MAG: universal stress protein [Thiolinea sp.]
MCYVRYSASEILEEARDREADLIIIRPTSQASRIISSVPAARVVRHAKCSVLVMR